MAFPTPTSIGETYFDSSSGRRWICSSLNPVVWSVDKSATLIVGPGGLSSSGFSQFGSGVKISGGLTAIGNVAISGNLTVGGAVITTLSEVVQIEDNIIQLNSNATVGASGGIEMYRGGDGSRYILWDEDLDKWRFTNDGVNYVDLGAALSLPIATSSITGVAFFPNADFSVTPAGGVSLTGNVARTHIGQTFTGLQVFSSGLSANGLTGTLMTAAQPNITSVGILNGLSVNNGLSVTGGISITGGEQVFGGSRIQSGGLSVTGGIAGTILTPSQTNITAVGVLNGLSVNNGLSVTGSMTVTGGLFAFGGIAGVITSATPAQPNITSLGSLVALNTAGITSTQRVTISSGGLSVAGNIDGTIGTAAQPNITSLGTLTSLNTAGLTSSQTVNITNGGLSAAGPVFIQSNGLSVTGGIAGTILTPSQTNITAVGTLTSLNTAGLTSSQRVNISSGGLVVQAGGLSVTGGVNITGGAIFAGGLTSLGQVFVVAGQTANFFGSIVVSGNNIGIPDLTYETNAGVTWPSSSVPTYTLGDKWTNGANEYTWVGNAWVEINNAVSSAPFDSIPDGSVTPAKLSTGKPTWDSAGTVYVSNGLNVTGGQFIRTGGLSVTGGFAGTILTPSQTNITSVGVLNGLSVNNGLSVTGGISITGGINVGGGGLNVTGGASITGNMTINASTLSPIGIAPSYTPRAWLKYNGAGAAIIASGNVSSVSYVNTGLYTVNFTTAMPTANYATFGMTTNTDDALTEISVSPTFTPTTSSCRIEVIQALGPTPVNLMISFMAVH